MKEIKAYIKKHKLDEVTRTLRKIDGLTGMSVIECCGYGVGWGAASFEEHLSCRPGIKIEVFCSDELAEEVVSRIEEAAHTGLKGDGKIYVGSIDLAARISTGERGDAAV
jgi:nitrogen regulatory protein PII